MKKDKSLTLIRTGTETFGAAIGGALGLIGGPIGSIGGSIVGVLITKGLGEIADRFLSTKEKARIETAASLAAIGVKKNIDEGLLPRDDGFFESDETNRSRAEELFEGVLIKCKDEFEEKKIKFISNIYKNVAFDSSINPDNANQVLNSVQQFTYRQLKILALVGRNINNKFLLRKDDYRDDNANMSIGVEFLLQDFIYLNSQGLIYRSDDTAMLDISDVVPGIMVLTPMGIVFFKLLDLTTMEENEFQFFEQLRI